MGPFAGGGMTQCDSICVCACVCVSDDDPFSYTSLPDLRPRHVGSEVTSYGIEGISRVKSFGAFKREFKLDDVCDFVQTGVQVYYVCPG